MKEANTKLITETISSNLINKRYNQEPRGKEEVEFSNRQGAVKLMDYGRKKPLFFNFRQQGVFE